MCLSQYLFLPGNLKVRIRCRKEKKDYNNFTGGNIFSYSMYVAAYILLLRRGNKTLGRV